MNCSNPGDTKQMPGLVFWLCRLGVYQISFLEYGQNRILPDIGCNIWPEPESEPDTVMYNSFNQYAKFLSML